MRKSRELIFYKNYFSDFFELQNPKVREKITWTLRLLEDLDRIPEVYFKSLEGSSGLFEIRVQAGGSIFRIISFFDRGNVIVIGNGFQKKTRRTPMNEIVRGERIKKEYYEEKHNDSGEIC